MATHEQLEAKSENTLSPVARRALVACLLVLVFFATDHRSNFGVSETTGSGLDGAIEANAEGSTARRIAFLTLGVFGVVGLVAPGRKKLADRTFLGVLCAFFLVWCLLSVLWAADPGIAARRVAVLLCVAAGALAYALRFSLTDLPWVIAASAGAFAAVGLAAELAFGVFEPFSGFHRFAGTVHPNMQGVICALLCLAALWLAGQANRRTGFYLLAAVAFGLVLVTRSRTSLAALLIAQSAYWYFAARPKTRAGWTLVILVLGLGCLTAATVFELKITGLGETALLGREDSEGSTLTGRIPLWQDLLEYAEDRPMLGYGFGGFWTPDRIEKIALNHWAISSAHSVYLELLLAVGLVGVVLYALILLVALVQALMRQRWRPGEGYGFLVALILFGLAHGLLEATTVKPGFVSFVLWCGLLHLAFAPATTSKQEDIGVTEATDAEWEPVCAAAHLGIETTQRKPTHGRPSRKQS